ncbi:transposase [Streptomyces sp. NPDC001982]|uniref:transposase n=1 Tax=Streptomyces sp. NPDC001982 TaxID=3154405 RepID=UPI003334620A
MPLSENTIHTEHAGTYGCRRITAELRMDDGLLVNHKRVERITPENGIAGLRPRERVTTTGGCVQCRRVYPSGWPSVLDMRWR